MLAMEPQKTSAAFWEANNIRAQSICVVLVRPVGGNGRRADEAVEEGL